MAKNSNQFIMIFVPFCDKRFNIANFDHVEKFFPRCFTY